MQDLHPFGEHFKTWRERRGLSLKQAAGDIVSPQLLSQFENGKKSVSLTTLSRLLLSLGVDWVDFIEDYPGQRLNHYAPGILRRTTNSKDASEYLKEMEDYYADAPEVFNIIKTLVDYRLYQHLLTPLNLNKLNERLIEKVTEQSYFNRPEAELMIISLFEKKVKTEQVISYKDYVLDRLRFAVHNDDFSVLYGTTGVLSLIAGTLSKQGEYAQAQDTIDQTRKIMSQVAEPMYHFIYNIISLDIQEVYNWVRWDRDNIRKARQRSQEILNFMEANITYNPDPEISRYCAEIISFFKDILNELISEALKPK